MVLAAQEVGGIVAVCDLFHGLLVVGVILRIQGDLLHNGFVAGQLLHHVTDDIGVIGTGCCADPSAAPVIGLRTFADCVIAVDAVAHFFLAALGHRGLQRVAQQGEIDAPGGIEEAKHLAARALIGRADWNDCLNLNCFSEHPGESFQITGPSEGPVAESVFIAGMFVKYGREYAELCDHLHLTEEAASARTAIDAVEQATLTAGWDGAWFRRAYDAFGAPVGSRECDEGQIFIEPQGMCVMAGIGRETGQAEAALKSVEERLDTPYGVVLLQPAYTTYRLNLGEISSYPPGYKENAGIFCHNNPWISCAETVLGHGDRAFAVYKKTCPAYIEDISEIHRTEPYVYSQMVAGRDAPTFGEAKNSWLTGTAAWTFVNVSQYILGIQPTLDGLRVDPCIPHTLAGYTVTRRYRGAVYHIRVENPHAVQKGVQSVTVNGAPIAGTLLPLAKPGESVEVSVILG